MPDPLGVSPPQDIHPWVAAGWGRVRFGVAYGPQIAPRDPQIAERLFVSRHTVNAHLRNIYGKLGVTSRAAATAVAIDHGLR